METINISKKEYKKLQQYKITLFSILETISKNEMEYEYDIDYIEKLNKRAMKEYKTGKGIEANSIDEALSKFSRK